MDTGDVVFILTLVVMFAVVGGLLLAVFRMSGRAKVVIKVNSKRKEVKYEGVMTAGPGGGPAARYDLGGYVNVYYVDTDKGEITVNNEIYGQVEADETYEMQVRTFRDKVIAIEAVRGAVKDK